MQNGATATYPSPDPSLPPTPNEHLGTPGRWVSVEDAAAALSVNVSTVRRRIREGKLQAQKVHRPQGYLLRVLLHEDEQVAGPSWAQLGDQDPASWAPSYAQLAAPADRAEAMAAYNRQLLEPVLQELTRTGEQLTTQAEEIGRLKAELSQAREQLALMAPATTPEMAAESTPEGEAVSRASTRPWWRFW
jgi:hypothetical protein